MVLAVLQAKACPRLQQVCYHTPCGSPCTPSFHRSPLKTGHTCRAQRTPAVPDAAPGLACP
eukprot:scaffold242209_cov17-Tisochrysis_lutea.AAC.1